MEKECWRDTLSKYFIYTALAVVIGAICRYAPIMLRNIQHPRNYATYL